MLRWAIPGITIACIGLYLIAPRLPWSTRHRAMPAATGGLYLWSAGNLDRVGMDDAPQTMTPVSIKAARGGVESFQLVLRASTGDITGLQLSASDLQGPSGAVIPASSLTLYEERYVYVNQASPSTPVSSNRTLGPGWYADPLIPLDSAGARALFTGNLPTSITVGTQTNQPVWVDVSIPSNAAAGIYQGTIAVSWPSGNLSVPYTLKVWNFGLPARPLLRSSFGSHAPYNTDLATHRLLLAHRLMPRSVDPPQASPLLAYGLSESALPFQSGADSGNCTMSAPPSAARITAALALYPASINPYIYTADEIDKCTSSFPKVISWGRAIHQASPRVQNLITMTPQPSLFNDGTGTGRSAVDIWVVLPLSYDSAPTAVAQALAKGDEVWSYNALVQDNYSPKWEIDFPPIDFRIQPGFMSASLSLTGLLYWRIDLFTSDPWNDVSTYSDKSGVYPGEGMLIYPGQSAGITGPVPSLRLKFLRDGEEDYEYVQLLRNSERGNTAIEMSRKAASSWSSWTRDNSTLQGVRDSLGERLDQLQNAAVASPDRH